MNEKQGDQMQLFLEKRLEKKMHLSNPSYQSMGCVIHEVINSSILQETFPAEMRQKEWVATGLAKTGSFNYA